MKPIAVLFANFKGNIGDFAILHAMLLDLEGGFPGHPLHVFSHGFHGVDEKRLHAFRASAPEFVIAGTTYAQSVERRLLRLVPFLRGWPAIQALQVQSLAARSGSDASRFREYEAIFLAGGAHWSGSKVGISMFGTLRAVHRHNDRIYSFPFSVSHSLKKYNSRQALQRYFSQIREPLIVRDGITKGMMDTLGLTSVLGADCVFSMQDLAAGIGPMEGRDPSRILFVLTGGSRKDLEAALRRVSPFRSRIALLTTCEPEDGQMLEPLSREFGIPYHAPATWQETVSELKASSLVVTNRLHGLILSSFAKTPLLPVANRTKAEAFVTDAQLPHSAVGVDALTTNLLERCLADRDLILERMAHYQSRSRSEIRSPLPTFP